MLKIYWGLKKAIRLAPGVTYAKARNTRDSIYDFVSVDDAAYVMMLEEAQKVEYKIFYHSVDSLLVFALVLTFDLTLVG